MVALGAAFALALIFAGIALRAGRRARRREREFKAISAAAATDALTGILNRRGFTDAAERELARASRTTVRSCSPTWTCAASKA